MATAHDPSVLLPGTARGSPSLAQPALMHVSAAIRV